MAFALKRKKDYKTSLNYVKLVVDNSKDQNAIFIAKRLQALLLVQSKKAIEGVKDLEDLLEYSKNHEMEDEISMLLYDLGFALLNASSFPPTMMAIVPSMALGSPPETGASSMVTPFVASFSSSSIETAGAIELISIKINPGPAPSSTPFSPKTTSLTWGELGSIVMRKST